MNKQLQIPYQTCQTEMMDIITCQIEMMDIKICQIEMMDIITCQIEMMDKINQSSINQKFKYCYYKFLFPLIVGKYLT